MSTVPDRFVQAAYLMELLGLLVYQEYLLHVEFLSAWWDKRYPSGVLSQSTPLFCLVYTAATSRR